jgi:serine protease Do
MRAAIILYLCTFLVCCQSIENESKYVSNASEALQSTKQIVINNQGTGSAFYLGGDLWATAKHCVMEMKPGGMWYNITMNGKPCEIVVASVAHDVAIFRIKTEGIKPFKFANDYPGLGGVMYSTGWHFGYEETFSVGYVAKHYDDTIVHTVPMNPGCSGGPTLDTSFNIIGVNSAILTMYGGWNGVSYSAKGHLLKDLFDFARAQK